ncbi:MAG: ACT domain-containing protein [Clostridia bacterium]|nr:ACT domain-containing protein [Clostridia bacterium]MDR3644899.1 ACT domain-containing protein [Clostridia bacterium]
MVKQISVFLENKAGRLAEVTRVLGENGINIRALSIADTTDYGVLRLIVNDPEKAWRVLKDSDFTASFMDVLAIGIVDEAGSLSKTLGALQDNGVVIEYMYAFSGKSGDKPLVILKLSDNAKAMKVLAEEGVAVIDASEVYSL